MALQGRACRHNRPDALRAADQPFGPQARAAGGLFVAVAVLVVVFRKLAERGVQQDAQALQAPGVVPVEQGQVEATLVLTLQAHVPLNDAVTEHLLLGLLTDGGRHYHDGRTGDPGAGTP